MKIHVKKRQTGFTITEAIVSVAIVGLVFATLYQGMASGFGIVHLGREELRANQIIVEKMETIRLYNWDQVNSNGFIPRTFTAPFFPVTISTNEQAHSIIGNDGTGTTYYGTVTITNAPLNVPYSTNMRLVTVSLEWTNKVPRVRELQTLISRDGVQNYIYY